QKPAAKAILFAVPPETAAGVRDCFRQFGVEAIPDDDRTGTRLQREQFAPCVGSRQHPMRAPPTQPARQSSAHQRIRMYGAAGRSLRTDRSLNMNSNVGMTFALPGESEMKVRALVAWVNAQEQRIGVRFDPSDQRRTGVKQWVDKYLDI